jgi:fumarate reductase flavoprotein subunit
MPPLSDRIPKKAAFCYSKTLHIKRIVPMKFKTIYLLPALPFLLLSLAACNTGTGPSEGPATLYRAGTYTGIADGYGGIIKVSVAFSDDSIMTIAIDSNKESQNREGVAKALTQIPQAIIDDQTLTVDVISGATKTSKGILKAVEKCALAAGGENAVEKLLSPQN